MRNALLNTHVGGELFEQLRDLARYPIAITAPSFGHIGAQAAVLDAHSNQQLSDPCTNRDTRFDLITPQALTICTLPCGG